MEKVGKRENSLAICQTQLKKEGSCEILKERNAMFSKPNLRCYLK